MTLSLAPPAEDVYDSLDDAIRSLNIFAATEGYAIVKTRSKSSAGVMKRVDLQCNKGGKKKAYFSTVSEDKQRILSTRRTNCPFKMQLYLEEAHWKARLCNGNHNHTATKAIAHPTHRQLDSSCRREIERQCDAGITPQQTHVSLLLAEQSERPVLLSDINNARYRHRALKQGPRTAIQALIEDL
jgi:hypothetical protein